MDERLNDLPCGYLVTNLDGEIIESNETLRKMLEVEENELTGQRFQSLLTIASKMYFQTYFTPLMNTYHHVEEMYVVLKHGKEKIPVLMNANERKGRFEFALMKMNIRDEYENELITSKRNMEKVLQEVDEANKKLQRVLKEYEEKKQELMELNEQLTMVATTDPLTGLKNRRYVQQKVDTLLKEAESDGAALSIVLIDVDHFKKVNDTYGHQVGDAVLMELASALENSAQKENIVARMGGEEFMIVLPGTTCPRALEWAERFRLHIAMAAEIDPPITVSLGVTGYELGDTYQKLLLQSDQALYDAKHNGRNRVSVHSS